LMILMAVWPGGVGVFASQSCRAMMQVLRDQGKLSRLPE